MLCPNCRRTIPDGSRFCNFCGTTMAAAAPVEGFQPSSETVLSVLRPSFLFVGIRYAAAVVTTVFLVVVGAFAAAKIPAIAGVVPWVVFILALIGFVNPIWRHILRQCEYYTLTTEKVEIRTGLLSRTTRNIPLRKIQDVTTHAGPFQRLIGLGDVVIDSASETGKIALRNIPNPEAVSSQILERIGR